MIRPSEDLLLIVSRSEVKGGSGNAGNPSLECDLAGMDGAMDAPSQVTVDPEELHLAPESAASQATVGVHSLGRRSAGLPTGQTIFSSETDKSQRFTCYWSSQRNCQGWADSIGTACKACKVRLFFSAYRNSTNPTCLGARIASVSSHRQSC